LVALEEGGLLIRVKTTSVLILSTGQLEQYFRKHLRLVIDAMMAPPQAGTPACTAEMAGAA